MDKLDLAAIRRHIEREPGCLCIGAQHSVTLLDAIDGLLALPTPYRQGTHEEYKTGFDHGFNGFRREARKLFGVGDE